MWREFEMDEPCYQRLTWGQVSRIWFSRRNTRHEVWKYLQTYLCDGENIRFTRVWLFHLLKVTYVWQINRYLWISDGLVFSKQKAVYRVNCIDCLDRTNVVQVRIDEHVNHLCWIHTPAWCGSLLLRGTCYPSSLAHWPLWCHRRIRRPRSMLCLTMVCDKLHD